MIRLFPKRWRDCRISKLSSIRPWFISARKNSRKFQGRFVQQGIMGISSQLRLDRLYTVAYEGAM
jgi:hypothetical protein